MLQPKISVVMPIYNAESYLRVAIESILNQTYSNFEFIMLNDGSTDQSLGIMRSYETDERVIVVDNPVNIGYTKNIIKGVGMAKGQYIARMDADDISFPARFEKQVLFLDSNPDYGMCGTNIELLFEDKSNTWEKWITIGDHDQLVNKLLYHNPICHPTVMLRKQVLDSHSLVYDADYEPAEEYKLWTEVCRVSRIMNLPDVLLHYRISKGQVSQSRNEIQRKQILRIRDEFRRAFVSDLLSSPNHIIDRFFDQQEQETLAKKDKQITQLNAELRSIYGSKLWRIVSYIYSLINKIK